MQKQTENDVYWNHEKNDVTEKRKIRVHKAKHLPNSSENHVYGHQYAALRKSSGTVKEGAW